LADAGNYVDTVAAFAQTPCAKGAIQDQPGQSICRDAAPGYYVSLTGQSVQTKCAVGTYQPDGKTESCLAAPAGKYVAGTGATEATLCAAGAYQPATGQSSCIQASAGYYVPTAGATAQVQCPGGTTSVAGATACTPISPSYSFSGFFQPVDNLPTVNTVKAGSAIPVKFSLAGNQGLNIFAAGYPVSQKIACDSSAPLDDIEVTVTAGSSSLSYDASSNQYNYVWKTDKAWAGTCRQLIVRLIDSTDHKANFKFK
jgi:hypothetical protein